MANAGSDSFQPSVSRTPSYAFANPSDELLGYCHSSAARTDKPTSCGTGPRRLAYALLVTLFVALPARAQSPKIHSISGVVLDQRAAPIPNAHVSLFDKAARLLLQTETDNDGRFTFPNVDVTEGTLSVSSKGFAEFRRSWSTNKAADLHIVLAPAIVTEQVVVTATRTETVLRDMPASIRVLPAAEFDTTAALRLDDVLRLVPGFQLFRRSGSRIANPTSQGVSLRGVGASGASRSVVLADEIPLNDPFGGWVYWGRVPRQSLSRVEVMRGAASDLYGSGALGGVINLLTKKVDGPAFSFDASYGNQNTLNASLFLGTRRGRWSTSLAAESFKTEGYVPVAEAERGRIDSRANASDSVLDFKLQFDRTRTSRFFIGAAYFAESRQNGTPFQINRTHLRQFRLGGDEETRFGLFGVRAYATTQVFDQNFSAVAADRNSETPTRVQRVPAQAAGLSLQWSRPFGSRQTIVSGLDAKEVRGSSDELAFTGGRISALIGAGGRERDAGFFIKDIVRVTPRFSLIGGARFDRWRNFLGHTDTRPLSPGGSSTVARFIDRSETALSPQLSFVYNSHNNVAVFASAYRGFRAPTLNELYRSFRVGNVLTLANATLRAEKLNGVEGGLSFSSAEGRVTFRGTLFRSEISNSIANVTLNTTPNLITRERRNLGSTRSQGFELETEIRPGARWLVTAGYLFADARVARFPGTPALEGLAVPQIARHSLAAQLRYTNPRKLNFGLQARIVGRQFDDDLNQFRLPGYWSVDAIVSRRLSPAVELFAAAENLFNQRYVVGRTPITTLGPPLLVRGGLRVRLPRK